MRVLAAFKYFIKRNLTSLKIRTVVYVTCTVVIFLLFLHAHLSAIRFTIDNEKNTADLEFKQDIYEAPRVNSSLKFILLWTDPSASPFVYFGNGQTVFKNKSCRYANCYVTGNRNYLGNSALFDVVLFNGPQLTHHVMLNDLPKIRSRNQKFVYANIESVANYPLCSKAWNGYFNWTWTYRLDSDATWSYFVVKNATNAVIGPKLEAQWINVNDMDDISDILKAKLKTKNKAAAWFASNCVTQSDREGYVSRIREQLKNFSLDVDVYGKCGEHQCPKEISDRCLQLLQRVYYFYFAFENSISVDYVTEKILHAYHHDTVPVVFGGANYSRFLPTGSYLNAYELGPEKLASKMSELMKNPQQYYKYFRWKKYYSFHFKHQSPDTDDYCKFCAILNNNGLLKKTSIHENFDVWWNDNITCYKHRLTHFFDEYDDNYRSVLP